tara:strand:+ start:730 stop:1383 length:654 start_codon:yes stop_codon:yes gene_type:complete
MKAATRTKLEAPNDHITLYQSDDLAAVVCKGEISLFYERTSKKRDYVTWVVNTFMGRRGLKKTRGSIATYCMEKNPPHRMMFRDVVSDQDRAIMDLTDAYNLQKWKGLYQLLSVGRHGNRFTDDARKQILSIAQDIQSLVMEENDTGTKTNEVLLHHPQAVEAVYRVLKHREYAATLEYTTDANDNVLTEPRPMLKFPSTRPDLKGRLDLKDKKAKE